MTTSYNQAFFDEMDEPNFVSARIVAPTVLEFIRPKSVVDVGCGRGLWLKAFLEQGVKDVAGYDGDYVELDKLAFPKASFHAVDLEKPITLDRSFDLAVCLEVGEHLSDSVSDELVKTLTAFAPVVLFSAAIPLQGGSRHINEQWPEYWMEKFAALGYVPVDCIRRKIWNDKRVSFFYAQNIFFFVRKSELSNYPKLKQEIENGNDVPLPFVHPHMYLYYAERWRALVPFLGLIPNPILHRGKRFLQLFSYMTIAQIMRYLISGFTAAGTNLATLYALVEFGGIHYLPASVIALGVGIVVSFLLHKLFTFRVRRLSQTHIQFGLYLGVVGLDFAINLAIMWTSVEILGIPYFLAAIISGGVIAVVNFIAYRFFVFAQRVVD